MQEFEEKTKEDLIKEIGEYSKIIKNLRQQLAKVEKTGDESKEKFGVRLPRKGLETNLEMVGDFDILYGTGEDYSKGGMSFKIPIELEFEIRFDVAGKAQDKRAKLIWVKYIKEEGYKFGVEFIESSEEKGEEF